MEVCPNRYFHWCGYFRGHWVSFATTDEFSVRVTQITSRIGVSWTCSLLFCFWHIFSEVAILSEEHKTDKFESRNSLKLSFTYIWGLRSNFAESEYFLESNSPDILALCETNLDDLIDFGNFSLKGYFTKVWKDSATNMHGHAVYMKEGLPFAWDLSLENSADSYLCFRLTLLHTVPYFRRSPSSSLCTIFDIFSANIDEVLSINPIANVFVFGGFKDDHEDCLTYSGRTDRPGELCCNFSISNGLTQMVNFPTRIPDCDSTILLFCISFFRR